MTLARMAFSYLNPAGTLPSSTSFATHHFKVRVCHEGWLPDLHMQLMVQLFILANELFSCSSWQMRSGVCDIPETGKTLVTVLHAGSERGRLLLDSLMQTS